MLQCLTPDIALSVLKDDGKDVLTEENYQQISTVLLYYIINLQDLCVSNAAPPPSSFSSSSGNFQFYLLALTNLHPAEDNSFLSSNETESILQVINQHYEPSSHHIPSSSQVREHFLTGILFLPCVRLHINNSVFPYHSASMQLISWKMLMLREIQVLVHLLFPEWPQPSLAIFSKATVSERETCHLLPSLQIISFILLTAQVTCRLWVSSKEHVCIFSFQTTATHHYL